LELGCVKFPMQDKLPGLWEENKEALLNFMKQVHVGVSGVVRDVDGALLSDVTISVEGIQHNVTSSQYGDYWRLLTSGEYSITASKTGYTPSTLDVTIPEGATPSSKLNFVLVTDDSSSTTKHDEDDDAPSSTYIPPKYPAHVTTPSSSGTQFLIVCVSVILICAVLYGIRALCASSRRKARLRMEKNKLFLPRFDHRRVEFYQDDTKDVLIPSNTKTYRDFSSDDEDETIEFNR